jgi:FAD:protein FMN transferase
MPKMSIELTRHALNGPTMGTRWSALVHAPASTDPDRLRAALAQAVDEIDCQMSTWKPDSDLMRMNAAPPGLWVDLPPALMRVLAKGLEIGRASNGAFDIGLGDLTNAWGFGPQAADAGAIRAHLGQGRPPAHDVLELDAARCRARKHGNLQLDLSGIAKGYGVDRMMAVIERFGIESALVSLDGELRAKGARADGRPWTVAIEKPDYEMRANFRADASGRGGRDVGRLSPLGQCRADAPVPHDGRAHRRTIEQPRGIGHGAGRYLHGG